VTYELDCCIVGTVGYVAYVYIQALVHYILLFVHLCIAIVPCQVAFRCAFASATAQKAHVIIISMQQHCHHHAACLLPVQQYQYVPAWLFTVPYHMCAGRAGGLA